MKKEKEQKKEPMEMTTEEAISKLFPPKVVEKLKEIACDDRQKGEKLKAD